MDVEKESKEIQFLDINQTMNNLLTKVAETITGPQEDVNKNLSDIRDILINIKQIDKTASYILTEETIKKVDKALKLVDLPTDKSLKSIGVETPTPEKTFKLDDSEVPQTEEKAREKFNQIVNNNLDKTIKAINDVLTINAAESKGELDIPETDDSAGKILSDILLTLLAKSLKEVSNLEFPDNIEEKENQEINLNPIKGNKNLELLGSAVDKIIKTDENNLLEGSEELEVKEVQVVDQSGDKPTKVAFGIGQFPTYGDKLEENKFSASFEEGKQLLNDGEFPVADMGDNKLDVAITSAEDAIEKSSQTLTADATKAIKTQNEPPSANPPQSKDQIGIFTGVNVPDQSGEKPGTPNEWYGNWGFFFGKGNDPNNSVANSQLSAAGISASDTNAFTNKNFGFTTIGAGLQRAIGSTLTFFGITSGDIGRFVNSQRRTFNTVANAFELTTGIQGIEMSRPNEVGNDARRKIEGFLEYYDLEAYRYNTPEGDIYENKRTGKIGLTQEDLPQDQQEWISQPIKKRGKFKVTDENFSRSGDYPIDEMKIDIPIILKTINQAEASTTSVNVEPRDTKYTFDKVYRKRTFKIVNSKVAKAPGFLRIYTRRGPNFNYSQEEVKVIPFQFDPVVSGDTKTADYATIATLGRSQSAQVYRRSNERNISLELSYVVVNSPKSPNDFTTKSINISGESSSLSASDMQEWTEDYIYIYIVRNLRNLTLPNIIGPRYKLAPPIVQVWYGGLNDLSASSTGSGENDPDNNLLRNTYPVFRTNWYTNSGRQQSYRSLWVCKSVTFEYKGGVVNNNSRNNVWVTAVLALTEIAPSITDNEVMLWAKIS